MKGKRRRKSKQSERLTITLGQDQHRRIAEIARKRRTSVAAVIRWAVDRYTTDPSETQERTFGGQQGVTTTGPAE